MCDLKEYKIEIIKNKVFEEVHIKLFEKKVNDFYLSLNNFNYRPNNSNIVDIFEKFFFIKVLDEDKFYDLYGQSKNTHINFTSIEYTKKIFEKVVEFYLNLIAEQIKKEFYERPEFDSLTIELLEKETIYIDNIKINSLGLDTLKLLRGIKRINFSNCKFECKVNLLKFNEVTFSECVIREIYSMENITENKIIANEILLYNCNIESINCKGIHFKSKLLKYDNTFEEEYTHKVIKFLNCHFDEKFLLPNTELIDNLNEYSINEINLDNTTFEKKVEIKNVKIDKLSLNNTIFKYLCDFYNTEFINTNFSKTDFKDISVFTECTFYKKVNLTHTTFEKLVIFRNAKIRETIDLKDAIIKEKANFLEMEKNVENRETARIIKDSFEQQSNIIEANKFYALEMQEREKELNFFKEPFEWFVFKFHNLSSNHSQNWVLSLFWIINITFLFNFLGCEFAKENNPLKYIDRVLFFAGGLGLAGYGISKLKEKYINLSLLAFTVFSYFMYINSDVNDSNLKEFSNLINPFSIMTKGENLDISTLIYKITIAYLIYQLIISIRQNTRRK